jgi:hypothetical protein
MKERAMGWIRDRHRETLPFQMIILGLLLTGCQAYPASCPSEMVSMPWESRRGAVLRAKVALTTLCTPESMDPRV